MIYYNLKFKEFIKYKGIIGKKNSLYTFIIYNVRVQDWINKIYTMLEKCKNMKNQYKQQQVNNRLYSIITYLKSTYSNTNITLNAICLVYDELYFFPIPPKHVNTLVEFNIRTFSYYCDDYYRIDILDDIFFNNKYYNYIKIVHNKFIYSIGTTHKKKTQFETNIRNMKHLYDEILKINVHKSCGIIYGNSSFIKKLDTLDNWYIIPKDLSHNELLNEFNTLELKKNNLLLENIFEMIEKADNKLIIGKNDTQHAINIYMVKELYSIKSKLSELQALASPDHFNFPIIIIGSLEKKL